MVSYMNVIHRYIGVGMKKDRMIPIRLSEKFIKRIDRIVGRFGYRSRSDFIRDALRHYTKEVAAEKVVRVRNLSKGEAKRGVREYLKRKDKAWMDEIADELKLNFPLVVKIVEELEEEGLVGEA